MSGSRPALTKARLRFCVLLGTYRQFRWKGPSGRRPSVACQKPKDTFSFPAVFPKFCPSENVGFVNLPLWQATGRLPARGQAFTLQLLAKEAPARGPFYRKATSCRGKPIPVWQATGQLPARGLPLEKHAFLAGSWHARGVPQRFSRESNSEATVGLTADSNKSGFRPLRFARQLG